MQGVHSTSSLLNFTRKIIKKKKKKKPIEYACFLPIRLIGLIDIKYGKLTIGPLITKTLYFSLALNRVEWKKQFC